MKLILFLCLNLLISSAIACPSDKLLENDCQNDVVKDKKANQSGLISNYIKKPAKALSRINPKYPHDAARYGREAVVILSYGITADGEVENIEVIDSFTHRDSRQAFERAAYYAIKQWEYEPASLNGKKVYSCQNEVKMDFRLDNKGKAKSNFISKYAMLKKHLNSGDLKSAKNSLMALEKIASNAYELAYFHLISASYYQLNQSPLLQINALEKVIKHGGKKLLDEASYKETLVNLFILQTTNEQYANALKTFWKIRGANFPDAKFQEFKQVKNSIEKMIRSDEMLVLQAVISEERNFFRHSLSRSKFSLHDLQGDLNKMEVRCGYHYQTYEISSEKLWNIPAEWGKCDIVVYGEKGSQFVLVEHTKMPS